MQEAILPTLTMMTAGADQEFVTSQKKSLQLAIYGAVPARKPEWDAPVADPGGRSYRQGVPPRRRFEDPLSEMAWRVIEQLDAGLQHELLRELATSLAVSAGNPRSQADKVRAAVVAVREVAELLGYSPSIKDYRAARVALPELKLPPDGTLRRWLGGNWNECLRRALLDAVSDGDFASRPIGMSDRYADAEVLAALRDCAAELGHAPTVTEYLAWARRPDVRQRAGRRPTSYRPLERFGGIRKALEAAGVVGEREAAYSADGRVLPLRYRYDDADIRNALVTVAQRLGRSPRPSEYQHERQRVRDDGPSSRENSPLPTIDVIRKRYGSWNAALSKAMLRPLEHPSEPHLGRVRPSYSDDDKLGWIRQAWQDVGEPFTGAAYKLWRRRVVDATGVAIPCLPTIERTFGAGSVHGGSLCRAVRHLAARHRERPRQRPRPAPNATRRDAPGANAGCS
jgi:hypothetical protein